MIDVNKIIEIGNYGQGKSTRPNTNYVRINNLILYYSYETIVGFAFMGNTYLRENTWGPTTGKHLGWIANIDKKERLPRKEFEEKLKEAFIRNRIIDARQEIANNL